MGFGSTAPYTNTGPVPYPTQTVTVDPGSRMPPNAVILYDDFFNGSFPAWSQQLIGGNFTATPLNGFLRITQLMAMEGSTGSLQIYAGTIAGTGTGQTGAQATCDARRYQEFQGKTKLGCEVWYTFLPQMNREEALFEIAISQMDGSVEYRAGLRFDHLSGSVGTDFEKSAMAPAPGFYPGSTSSSLTFTSLPAQASADGYYTGKWNHLLIEADFSSLTWIRGLLNETDYTSILAGKQLASQLNAEARKSGIEAFIFNQVSPVRGGEYFLGRAIFYKLS